MSEKKTFRLLPVLHSYLVFFLMVAFLISCCLMLFTSTLIQSTGLTLTEENLRTAALATFGNVLFFSLLLTVIDLVRRSFTVNRPVKRILEGAERIMAGDFSVRIQPVSGWGGQRAFNEIIGCFNQMAQELSGTETLRTDFIANVSHELKTPLAVMQNYAVMLQQPGLSERDRQDYARAIHEASRRLADLITNILKLNKLENQNIFPTPQPYDLGEQLCQCLLSFEDLWEEKGLELETDLQDGVQVSTDREMMSLVWNNLFSNAIKFTDPGGTIGLSLHTEEDRAVVRIRDTGCGISQEVGARMFDKFYQGDTSHAAQGNGLGLALVKRVIDITGSDIQVESQVGKGTIFTVTIRRDPHETVQETSP